MFETNAGSLGFLPLQHLLQGLLNLEEENLSLAEVWSNQRWEWGKLSFELPRFFTEKADIIRPNPSIGRWNKPYWAYNKNGLFSIKSIYEALTSHLTFTYEFRWIWNLQIMKNIKYFLWICSRGRLLTNAYLYFIRISLDPRFPVYLLELEIPAHIFTYCLWLQNSGWT